MPASTSGLFSQYAKRAGLEGVTFHRLRDTFISRLAVHCDIATLMALARHRDYATTRRYVKIDGDHLRQAVEAAANAQKHDYTGTTNRTKILDIS